MIRSTTVRTGVAALALTTALAGCGANKSDNEQLAGCEQTYTIGFSHPVGEAQFVKALKDYVAQYGPNERCTEVLLDNTTGNNLEAQRATVEGWVTQQVDAIVLWPVDPSAFTNLMSRAQQQGTKWLTYVAPMDGQDGRVGFDAAQEGEQIAGDVADWLQKRYPAGGVAAAVTTLTTLPVVEGRWEPPMRKLAELGIPVVSEQDCADQSCGLQIAEDALRENPQLRVFIGLNDDVALGAQKAVQNSGLDVEEFYISGHDGSPEGLEAIKAKTGAFRATTAIPIADLGRSIIDNSIAAITGEGTADALTPTVLIHPDDTQQIDQLLATMRGS